MKISSTLSNWIRENIDWIDSLEGTVSLSELNQKVPRELQSEFKQVLKEIEIRVKYPQKKRPPMDAARIKYIKDILSNLDGIRAYETPRRGSLKDGTVSFKVEYLFINPDTIEQENIALSEVYATALSNSKRLSDLGTELDFGFHKGQKISAGIVSILKQKFPESIKIKTSQTGVGNYKLDVGVVIYFNP